MSMCVKTILKWSPIHGIGLFAAQDIKKGEKIWEFTPMLDLVLTQEQVDSLNPVARDQIQHYAFKTEDGRYVLVGDDNRFINFSINPNVQDVADIESPSIAMRNIKAGEELTCDYCFDFDGGSRNLK